MPSPRPWPELRRPTLVDPASYDPRGFADFLRHRRGIDLVGRHRITAPGCTRSRLQRRPAGEVAYGLRTNSCSCLAPVLPQLVAQVFRTASGLLVRGRKAAGHAPFPMQPHEDLDHLRLQLRLVRWECLRLSLKAFLLCLPWLLRHLG